MRTKARYRYVEHTADVKFIAYGESTEALFANSAMALFNIMAGTSSVGRQKAKTKIAKISVRADDRETLLWRFLQRCLSLLEVRSLFAYGIEHLSLSGGKVLLLRCELKCRDMDPKYARLEAKGISKYDMHITKGHGMIRASVVVDV